MRWLRLDRPAGSEPEASAVTAALFGEGAVAVEREGALLAGWFIDAAPPGARAVDAPHWAAAWLREQRVVRVSERVSVGPSFLAESALVRVNPGLAFGTGTHPTTWLCLQALEKLAPGRRVLDIGTGTGVLAVTALKLGALSALGTDNDPVALATAARVARLNGVELKLATRAPDGEQFDLVLANLPVEAQESLAAEVMRSASRDLIVSGFLEDVAIQRLYFPAFRPVARTARSGWAMQHLVRER
jgi:ribosomal protein L11 methyltransferase